MKDWHLSSSMKRVRGGMAPKIHKDRVLELSNDELTKMR